MNGVQARRAWLALVVAVALVAAACTSIESRNTRAPQPATDPLPVVDTAGLWLPRAFEELEVVDPGWDIAPQHLDGTYLSAGERDGALEFSAVDVHGEVRWTARRPISCTGFVVTTDADGRALAILTDTATTDAALAATTATAYELSTGEHVWGPVEVPGPHQGPGLVFAAPPEGYVGEGGLRTALDPTTGRVVVPAPGTGGRIVSEHHGTVLVVEDEALVARDTADGHERWRLALADHGWEAASVGPALQAPAGGERALVEVSASTTVLIDLADGTVLSDTARGAAVDATSGTSVVLDDAGLHAHGADGRPLWSLTVRPETTIAALGGVLLYLREGDAIRVHNVITGEVAEGYDPDGRGAIVVPTDISTHGGAVLLDGQRRLVATVQEPQAADGPVP